MVSKQREGRKACQAKACRESRKASIRGGVQHVEKAVKRLCVKRTVFTTCTSVQGALWTKKTENERGPL